MLFSVKTRAKDACLQLALEGDAWSKPVPINSLGLASFCEAAESDGTREVCYSVHISRAPGAFARTFVITIMPAFVAVNQTATALRLRQAGTPESLVLSAGEKTPFHWSRTDMPRRLQVLPSTPSGDALGWSSAFSPECSSFVVPFFPAALEAPDALVVADSASQAQLPPFALQTAITSSLGTLFLFFKPCTATLFPVAVRNNTSASVITVRQCGAPWSTALQLQPWESQPWALPLLEAPAEVEVSVRCVGEEPGGESLRPCLRIRLDGQEGDTTLVTEMETMRVSVAMESCTRVLQFQAEHGRASLVRLIRCENAVEDIQAAKRQEVAMCVESLETPADSEVALVLHVVYGFDVLATEFIAGSAVESTTESMMESTMESTMESMMEVEVTVGEERRTFSAVGGEFCLLDAVMVSRPGRAVFSVRLRGKEPMEPMEALEAVGACDLALLASETNTIKEVVVPCTQGGGRRTLCRLWVRLFMAPSRISARLQYEIACLERQEEEVKRAASRLEEEQKKVISGLGTPSSPLASELTTPLESSPQVAGSGEENRMNVCVLLHAVRSIPCSVSLEAPYAVVTLGRTQLRSPCGVVDADEALWSNPSVVVKCRSMKSGFSLQEEEGVLRVCRVDQNSLAEHAGLRVGHLLASVNRAKPPHSLDEFTDLVSRDFNEKYLQFIAPPRRALQKVALEQRLFFPRGCSVGEERFTVELFDERPQAEDVLLLRATLPLPRDGNADWSESVNAVELKETQERLKGEEEMGLSRDANSTGEWCVSVGVSWNEEKAEEEVMAWSVRVALKGLQLSVVDSTPQEILLVTVDQIVGECGVFETGRRYFRGKVGNRGSDKA